MKIVKYIIALLSAMVLLVNCGESLEDTYDDGGGKIRYLGRPTSDLKVSVGWKRLILNWENSVDADIDSWNVAWRVAESEILRDYDASPGGNLVRTCRFGRWDLFARSLFSR